MFRKEKSQLAEHRLISLNIFSFFSFVKKQKENQFPDIEENFCVEIASSSFSSSTTTTKTMDATVSIKSLSLLMQETILYTIDLEYNYQRQFDQRKIDHEEN